MEMTEREKVTKGLECCRKLDQDCGACPYNGISFDECVRTLMADAIQAVYRQTEADRLQEAVEQVKAGRVRRYIGDGFEVVARDAD